MINLNNLKFCLLAVLFVLVLAANVSADNVYIISGHADENSELYITNFELLGPEEEYNESPEGSDAYVIFYPNDIEPNEFYFDLDEFFSFSVIIPDDTTKIVFKDALSLEQLFEFNISESSPEISNLSIFKNGNYYDISWTASDNDGDNLLFDIYYSVDDSFWKIFILNTNKTNFSIPSQALEQGKIEIKIIATDGFNTGEAISESFSVYVNKNPLVFIDFPMLTGEQEFLKFVEGQEISFSGTAEDLESGELDNYQWESNLGGFLSAEQSFVLNNLSLGEHIITLSSTDGEETGEDSINLIIIEENVNELTGCGVVLSEAGKYILVGNITTTDTGVPCFSIESDNVLLDFNSYSLEGNGQGIGVEVKQGFRYATIKNGAILGFANSIILSGNYNTIQEMVLSLNKNSISLFSSHGNTIKNNQIFSNGNLDVSGGIVLNSSKNNIIENNTLTSNTDSLVFLDSDNNHIISNTIQDNTVSNQEYANASVVFVNSWDNILQGGEITGSDSDYDFYLAETSLKNVFLNIVYEQAKEYVEEHSTLTRQWYYTAIVKNERAGPLENASVEFYLIEDFNPPKLIKTKFTDEDGKARAELDSYFYDGLSKTNYSYFIKVGHEDYESEYQTISDFNENIQKTFYLETVIDYIDGDVNQDGTIGTTDLTILATNFGDIGCTKENGWCGGADVNKDGNVTTTDLTIISTNFGYTI